MNEQAVCLGPWGKGVCERPPQPCPAYSFSWRPSLMPVSHAAGDEHFTATVQFLCLGTLTFPASSKRILFIGLCWDGNVLDIRLIDSISYCRLFAVVYLLIYCFPGNVHRWLFEGTLRPWEWFIFSGQPRLIEKMRLFSPVWCCGSSIFLFLFCSAFVFFLSVSWSRIVDGGSLRIQQTFLQNRHCIRTAGWNIFV